MDDIYITVKYYFLSLSHIYEIESEREKIYFCLIYFNYIIEIAVIWFYDSITKIIIDLTAIKIFLCWLSWYNFQWARITENYLWVKLLLGVPFIWVCVKLGSAQWVTTIGNFPLFYSPFGWAIEYTDCISAEKSDPALQRVSWKWY